jgi:hypothetical protein
MCDASGNCFGTITVVNCVVSNFADATACTLDAANNKYYKTQTRTVTTPAAGNGQACPLLTQKVLCPPVDCVVDGGLTDPKKCDNATTVKQGSAYNFQYFETQSFIVTAQPKFGGAACPSDVVGKGKQCPNVDCQLTSYAPTGKCNCSTFKIEEARNVTAQHQFNGAPCSTFSLTQMLNCTTSDIAAACASTSDDSDSSLSAGIIVVIVLAVLLAVFIILYVVLRARRSQSAAMGSPLAQKAAEHVHMENTSTFDSLEAPDEAAPEVTVVRTLTSSFV